MSSQLYNVIHDDRLSSKPLYVIRASHFREAIALIRSTATGTQPSQQGVLVEAEEKDDTHVEVENEAGDVVQVAEEEVGEESRRHQALRNEPSKHTCWRCKLLKQIGCTPAHDEMGMPNISPPMHVGIYTRSGKLYTR